MAGQVEAEFLAAIGRFAGPVRGAGVVLLSAFGVASAADDGLPLAFALLGLMVVGAVADFVGGRRVALVFAVVRVVAVVAAQGELGGEARLWALNVLTTTAITLQWEWGPEVAVPVTAALLGGWLWWAGFDGAVVLRVVVECSLARLAFVVVRRSTRRVDVSRVRRAEAERAEALAAERRAREREYLALLHDTASATFLVVATEGIDPDAVAGYARRDLALLTGTAEAQDSLVDVGTSLRAVADRSPLRVDTRTEPATVPASVALAMVRAVREALVNVERHAGTGHAELAVRAAADRVVVTVADRGPGFDPDRVSGHRRGISGSIVARMAGVGGVAAVTSAAGGTTVRLAWPA
ncbi:ATP-binding protein [Actinosynnema sp. NPDC047251]|uniref:Two-component system, sensor histidine kinase n=1 Tax=Saccharothrix espanaensis (strain ATCC 51144 / DSM 44229 / JCM 9112 / NBRC 15066 / NRRL 15764) TaxID=1179773 RepID=K0JU27_SACES|nr:ATP-binding protein [Saccharothrix espanaensis]CCH31320.1 Two-component system, sensor histidine kinase [Saccharothrix espanaensis DSM 44229]